MSMQIIKSVFDDNDYVILFLNIFLKNLKDIEKSLSNYFLEKKRDYNLQKFLINKIRQIIFFIDYFFNKLTFNFSTEKSDKDL